MKEEIIDKKDLPKEIEHEIDVFENLICKLQVSLNLPPDEWNKKVAPIMREFLEWHNNNSNRKGIENGRKVQRR